jgi:hypothetical protein
MDQHSNTGEPLTDTIVGSVHRPTPDEPMPRTVARGMRLVAFSWVCMSVYLTAMRFAMPIRPPIEILAGTAAIVASAWAALDGRRWGWHAMVLLAAASLLDLGLGLAVIGAASISSDGGLHQTLAACARELGFLGLGPEFGAAAVIAWLGAIAVLVHPSVRTAVFVNKRDHLRAGQGILAAILLATYLAALARMGATAVAVKAAGVRVVRHVGAGTARQSDSSVRRSRPRSARIARATSEPRRIRSHNIRTLRTPNLSTR